MKLIRFMGDKEFADFLAGKTLTNTKDHAKEDGNKTNSVGACFFIMGDREIHQAHKFLSGLTDTEHCVVIETKSLPRRFKKTWGRYYDWDNDQYIGTKRAEEVTAHDAIMAMLETLEELLAPPDEKTHSVIFDEYSTTSYSQADFDSWQAYTAKELKPVKVNNFRHGDWEGEVMLIREGGKS